jgi:outer membrane lipoprotein-sorting protein
MRFLADRQPRRHAQAGVLATAIVLAALAFAGCSSSNDEGVPGSFYLEATITVIDDRAGAAHSEVTTQVRWWSESKDRWRWEIDQSGVDESSGDGAFSLSDGEVVWFYSPQTNSYQRSDPFELPDTFVATPFPASILFGPANHATLDDLAAEFLSRADDVEVVLAGSDEVLGVKAALLDYRPTWRSSSSTPTLDASGSQTGAVDEDSSGGVGQMWIDEDHMFILRHEIDGGSNMQYVLVEVTRVDFDTAFVDDRFEFAPPDGATEEQSGGSGRSSGSGSS